MIVELARKDGEPVVVELDYTQPFTLREMARLERALPPVVYGQLLAGWDVEPTPLLLQALVWVKLLTVDPSIGLEDFELELELFDEEIPMVASG